tara:strand:+ start:334 stop:504 length:171 start_codon:yes stop_codon:yes gene_type:complete
MPTYKYFKDARTGDQSDVIRTDSNGDVSWISLSDPANYQYVAWKEWEKSNTTEAAD